MPKNSKEDIQKQIRRLTKKIGIAKNNHDYNEIANLRIQRDQFLKQLIEEYQLAYIIVDGKTKFVSLEEAEQHYENPEVRKQIALTDAINQVCQEREKIISKLNTFKDMAPEQVKETCVKGLSIELDNIENFANGLAKEIGKKPFDWKEIDKKKKEGYNFLEGIDISSLL